MTREPMNALGCLVLVFGLAGSIIIAAFVLGLAWHVFRWAGGF